jgi:sterol 3beta-glucosyltransferase
VSTILILCLGSRGDVVPYAAVGQALRARGHRVRLAAFENFRGLVGEMGLEFAPIRGDSRALLAATGGQALGEAGQNTLRQFRAIRATFAGLADSIGPDIAAAADGGVDLIVNQLPFALYGSDVAEKLSVPLLMAAVMPLARTRAWPALTFPAGLGRLPGFNRLSHPLAEQLVWLLFGAAVNRWRRTLGLRPHPPGGYAGRLARQAVPVLNGFSQLVVPRPADWGPHIHLTGYWFPPAPADWTPPESLRRFLAAGPPPVFLGFGSMPVRDPAAATQLLLEAVRLAGVRAILHTGWGGLGGGALPAEVYALDYAPFDWLIPQMAAIVHHGGAGTTGSALRAGVPSMVMPFVFDQFFWGQRVAALGVGPAPQPFGRLSAQPLAAAMRRMVDDSGMRQRAAALGESLAKEDGLGEAVRIVELAL